MVLEGGQTPEVNFVWEHNRRLLLDYLDALEGEKTIVWDRSVMQRANLFAGPSVLKEHGVIHNLALNQFRLPETPYALFFLAPTLTALDGLREYIDKMKPEKKTLFEVLFIPEMWYVVREKLKDLGGGKYWERLESVRELPLTWLPRDGDVLSLSDRELTSRLLINGDWTHLHRCAVAINQLMALCSETIPLYSRGKWAHDIARMVRKMGSTDEVQEPLSPALRLNRLVIIDRWIDPLTPFLHQLTYAGILDELYGISMVGSIKVSLAEFENDDGIDPKELKEIHLNDEVYHRLKHIHINAIGYELAKILSEIKEDEQFDRDRMSVAEYQVLVKKMPKILQRKKFCGVHMRLAEMARTHLYEVFGDYIRVEKELLESADNDKVHPFIEEYIITGDDAYVALRLIIVHSLTANGLKPGILQQYRRMITQSFGVETLNKLLKLQKMGVIRERGGTGKLAAEYAPPMFPQMKKQYDLLPENISETNTQDAAYAYSGYAPLIVRILEEGDRVKWTGWNKTFEESARGDDRTAVFVVGGATRSELACINLMPNVCLVSTSSIITGNRFLDNITQI
ncbi:Sec1 family protein [Dictyocaulus viviparus]|uniref:Sec1 family protein n=1 Tax=Dictyocaulus viviparus TaxID=29172 RepID=A0A0D8YA33_DICVI|nr:Sec1 family protein [Dictyocaulus viviparus]